MITATNKFNICKISNMIKTLQKTRNMLQALTKNEQKKMNETKYAQASEDPHESPSFFAFGSHGLPLRHASIMFGHDSPVAHLSVVNGERRKVKVRKIFQQKFEKNQKYHECQLSLPNYCQYQDQNINASRASSKTSFLMHFCDDLCNMFNEC